MDAAPDTAEQSAPPPATSGDDALERLVRESIRNRLFGGERQAVCIGRFELREVLGAGAMGVVYRAWDPKLERDIALKITRTTADPARALREARALARISHPNVVAVHDAEVIGDEVSIAMELVSGMTLRTWLDEARRSWSEIVDVFEQAALGLAAGHEAGVVHGDFKPGNVLIDDNGRVRVADFGVSRLGAEPTREAAGINAVTQATAFGGTPVYMAPEQLRGESPGPRSDLFSFSVTLYEALYGQRPYDGATVDELASAIERGDYHPGQSGPRIPGWLRKILERGLHADKADRFDGMGPLVEAIRCGRARRRRWGLAVATVGAVALGSLVVWKASQPVDAAAVCEGGDATFAEVWDASTRQSLRNRIVSANTGAARDAADRLESAIDRYGSSWRDTYRDACEATRVRHTESETLFDRRSQCLLEHLGELDSLLEVFDAMPIDDLQRKALPAVYRLASVDDCADFDRMSSPMMAIPAESAESVAASRKALNDAQARIHTGQIPEALRLAGQAVTLADDADYAPVMAEALAVQGEALQLMGDVESAEDTLRKAIHAGAEAADDPLIARAWILVLHGAATVGKHGESTTALADYVRAAIARAGDSDALLAAYNEVLSRVHANAGELSRAESSARDAVTLHEKTKGAVHLSVAGALAGLGDVLQQQGAYEDAETTVRRALDIIEEALGPHHPRYAQTLNSLGAVRNRRGDYAGAIALFQRAVAIYEPSLGPDSVYIADALNNLGSTHVRRGESDEAVAPLRRALAIYESSEQADSSDAISALANLGRAERELGHLDNARQYLERVVELREKALGTTHPATGHALNSLATVLRAQGDLARARELYTRTLSMWETTLGDSHPDLAIVLSNLGDLSLQTEDFRRALAYCGRALTIDEASLSDSHPDLAYDLTCLGRANFGLGRSKQAASHLQQALDLRVKGGVRGLELGKTRLALARAIASTEPARTRELLQRALEDAKDAGAAGDALAKEVQVFRARSVR